jgi:N-succinyldiaminopimelate aminotransferase
MPAPLAIRSNAQIAALGTTIFTTMSALAARHGAVNLGQGFPDEDGPLALREAAARALLEAPNQYPPMRGLASLRAAVAAHDRRFYGLDIDPDAGVLVTSGATEALASALLAYIEPGDEVIIFEPAYDSYRPMIERAGGTVRAISLQGPDWLIPWNELDLAFTARTRVMLLNTPMNPVGKVFTREELAGLAARATAHDLVVISDEVYEHLVFDGAHHVSMLELPGMDQRALKVGSAGKSFSFTGWKVGYVSGAPQLIDPVAKAHQFLTFTTPPNLQSAVAEGLGYPDSYFSGFIADLEARRDFLRAGLMQLGFQVLPCAGTYFLIADYSAFSDLPDTAFAEQLVADPGVAAIPVSAFQSQVPPGQRLIRFCFIKRRTVLEEGLARLARLARAPVQEHSA